jgi:acyl transferase domain-containing protein
MSNDKSKNQPQNQKSQPTGPAPAKLLTPEKATLIQSTVQKADDIRDQRSAAEAAARQRIREQELAELEAKRQRELPIRQVNGLITLIDIRTSLSDSQQQRLDARITELTETLLARALSTPEDEEVITALKTLISQTPKELKIIVVTPAPSESVESPAESIQNSI